MVNHWLIMAGWWLTYPSEKWWNSSVGIMKFPTEWKHIGHVPVTTNESTTPGMVFKPITHHFLETASFPNFGSRATLERTTRLCALSCHSCNVSQTGGIPPAQPCDILKSHWAMTPVTTAGHHCWSLDEIEENKNNATYQYFGLNQIFLTRVAKSQALRLRRTLKQQNKQKVTFCEQVSLHERNFVNQEEARDPNLGIGWASRLNEPSSTAWRIFSSAGEVSHTRDVLIVRSEHCQNIHHVAGWWLITIPNIWTNKKYSKPPTRYHHVCSYLESLQMNTTKWDRIFDMTWHVIWIWPANA